MRILPALLILLLAPAAHAQVYKCVDANGAVTYTNERNLGRGCKQLSDDQAVSSVPAPPKRPSAAQPSPSNFPRVAPDAQRARDDTRRQILEKELATEEAALAEAEKAASEQDRRYQGDERRQPAAQSRLQALRDTVELHQRNIQALRKELGSLR